MTATEVRQRTEEKLRLLGPILGRQHNELLKRIERVKTTPDIDPDLKPLET